MKNLTIKQLTNIALLIAISVGLVYFGILLMGLSSIPNLRAGFAGIPVKMAGFIYGPVVGIVTGAISDILGLIVFPTFYHPGYTLDLMISGFIPGLIGLMYRKHRTEHNVLAGTTNMVLGVIILGFMTAFIYADQLNLSATFQFSLFSYLIQMFLTVIIFNGVYIWHSKKDSKYLSIFWLIALSVLLTDTVTLFLVPIWDNQTLKIDYMTGLGLSMLYFGMKMWFNVALLYIVFSVLDKQISRQSEYNEKNDLTTMSRIK